MARPRGRHARIVGLALWSGAGVLAVLAMLFSTDVLPVADEVHGLLALVLGGVAAVDLLIGFWFFHSSLTA